MLKLNNISFAREEKQIIDKVDIEVKPGQLLVLKGDNGSGKTTLLKLMAGILKPNQGQITYNGYDIIEEYDEYLALLNYIGHQRAVKNNLTVYENLKFWAELRGAPELVEPAMHFFDLTDRKDVLCGKLSKGWQSKVALARLLAIESMLWLLDEPFSSLDSKSKEKLTGLIEVRCSQGGIVILSTHEGIDLQNKIELEL